LSRNRGNGKFVLAIDDAGKVLTTPNRILAKDDGWEELEIEFHKEEKVVTFRRVK
jgi:hypothetical protein